MVQITAPGLSEFSGTEVLKQLIKHMRNHVIDVEAKCRLGREHCYSANVGLLTA